MCRVVVVVTWEVGVGFRLAIAMNHDDLMTHSVS